MTSLARTLVIGDGISGRAVARALSSSGVPVTLLCSEPGEAGASAARPDGMDAALSDDDSTARHAEDLAELAGPTVDRAAIDGLTAAAPGLFEHLTHAGIPFERDRQGGPALERLAGSSRARTAHAGSSTAHHVSRRLGAELRALGAGAAGNHAAAFERRLGLDLVRLVLDDAGVVVGVVVRSHENGEIQAIRADGVCLATGGHAGLFADGERGARSLGGALGIAHGQGAKLAHAELACFGLGYRAAGFVRALPERVVALGELDAERGLLDLGPAERGMLRRAAAPALRAYEESTGRDPFSEPIPVVETPLRALGGLEVGFRADAGSADNHATTLPGLWAVGGAAYLYRGRKSSRGAPLVEALFGAERAANAIRAWRSARVQPASELDAARFDAAAEKERDRFDRLFERARAKQRGDTPFELLDELRRAVRERRSDVCDELGERLRAARIDDGERRANRSLALLAELEEVLALARAAAEVAT